MLTQCQGVVAVSAQVKSSLVQELDVAHAEAMRIRVVRNGVGVEALPGPSERADLRALWGVDEGQVLIVAAGRLTRQKNFAALVEALSRLAGESADWRCIIAGDGELRADLEDQIAKSGLGNKICLPGLVRDVRGLLTAADVFCLPSTYEGLPLVLLEAMSAGLPVVAFAIDGVMDVVADGEQARLAPIGDTGALAAALASLVDDPISRRAMGSAARELVVANFSFETAVDELETVYRA